MPDEISPTIGGFTPPLAPRDRFRSTLLHPRHGYCIVAEVQNNGVVAALMMPDGSPEGHVNFFWNTQDGFEHGGYTRLARG